MNARLTSLAALSAPVREMISQAITGHPNADDVYARSFEAVVADLEMLSQARINDEHDAVTTITEGDFAEQLYRVTRRAKASLALARLIEESDAESERVKDRRNG